MMAILFISLTVSVLLAAGITLLAFADVAFRMPQANTAASANPWQPPTIRGAELIAWARDNASRLTSDLLSHRDDYRAATDLAFEIRSGTLSAIASLHNTAVPRWTTDEKCYSANSVTAPEVVEIGDLIRHTQPAHEVRCIADCASGNAVRGERLDRNAFHEASIRCPLLSDAGTCLIEGAEPLQCRLGCPLEDDNPSAMTNSSASVPTANVAARSVAIGVRQGMSQVIESAGLDGGVYEFNSALAVALNTPDAASQWIQGGRLFTECRKVT
jgi:hypothetical protein